jgi:hypothetical protein
MWLQPPSRNIVSPRYFSFDLRVLKDIQVDPKHAMCFSGVVRNLTGHFNPFEVHSNIADPQYGTFFGSNDRRVTLDFDIFSASDPQNSEDVRPK